MDFPSGSDSKASAYSAETQVQSLDQDDLLEKEIATHSSLLAWETPWMEEPCRLQPMGCKETRLSNFTFTFIVLDACKLMLGKLEDRRRRRRQRMRWLDGITNAMDMNLSKLWEMVKEGRPGVLHSMGSQKSDMTRQLNNNILRSYNNVKSFLPRD